MSARKLPIFEMLSPQSERNEKIDVFWQALIKIRVIFS